MSLTIKDYTVGALTLALLISLGFNILPTDTHFCRDLGIAKQCDHLSSTGQTCYPLAAVKTGSKYCSSGWELIAKSNTVILPDDKSNIGAEYSCSVTKCIRIK